MSRSPRNWWGPFLTVPFLVGVGFPQRKSGQKKATLAAYILASQIWRTGNAFQSDRDGIESRSPLPRGCPGFPFRISEKASLGVGQNSFRIWSPGSHLPGFYLGHPFLTHSHLALESKKIQVPQVWLCCSFASASGQKARRHDTQRGRTPSKCLAWLQPTKAMVLSAK